MVWGEITISLSRDYKCGVICKMSSLPVWQIGLLWSDLSGLHNLHVRTVILCSTHWPSLPTCMVLVSGLNNGCFNQHISKRCCNRISARHPCGGTILLWFPQAAGWLLDEWCLHWTPGTPGDHVWQKVALEGPNLSTAFEHSCSCQQALQVDVVVMEFYCAILKNHWQVVWSRG